MKSAKVIYLITRTHGLKQHLLRSEDLVRMLRAKDIVEMSDVLLKTDYAADLSKLPLKELDAGQLERIFYGKLSERLSYLFQITSGKIRQVLEDYYRKIEVQNIKRILRAIHGKEKLTDADLVPIPRRYQTVNFSALLEVSSIRETTDLLKETPYKNLRDSIDLYEKYNNPLVLEAQTDKIYYNNLWQKLEQIPGSDQVKQLIGTEVDLNNLLHIFSFKQMKMEPDLLRELVINVYYKLPKSYVPQLIAAPYEAISRLLAWPPYVELTRKAADLLDKGMLADAENIFAQHLYSYAEIVALRNPNGLAYVFAYLDLCLREARNLTTLAVGKQLKLEEEKIRSALLL